MRCESFFRPRHCGLWTTGGSQLFKLPSQLLLWSQHEELSLLRIIRRSQITLAFLSRPHCPAKTFEPSGTLVLFAKALQPESRRSHIHNTFESRAFSSGTRQLMPLCRPALRC